MNENIAVKILLSNDDGIYAQGLRTLYQAVKDFGEVRVVAPDRNRSGASNSLTLTSPLRVKNIEPNFWSVEGTPTDCVHLALTGLYDDLPDIVISGINEGANLGDDILYSGTVAAATEGRSLGLPSVAISLAGIQYFETAAWAIQKLLRQIIQKPLQSQTILNVNVPDVPLNLLRSFEVTRLGSRHVAEPVIKSQDPRGHDIYWVGAAGLEADAGPGTDFHAIANRHVSLTPLKIDLTDYKQFETVSQWCNEMSD